MKTLGEKIRELREERDLSLRELAKKLNLSAAFLSDIELGRRNPSDKVLSDLAKLISPKEMHAEATFNLRGGLKTTVKADYKK